MTDRYDDIIDMPHHVSNNRPRMSMSDRAAQFAPFAALTGFGAVITEAGRQTDERIPLGESDLEALNEKVRDVMHRAFQHPLITVTYFVPDSKKAGGTYKVHTGNVRTVSEFDRVIIFDDETKILLDDTSDICFTS